jgi:hypothetical protein
MKRLWGAPFDQWRVRSGNIVRHLNGIGDETCGAFMVPVGAVTLGVIASTAEGWDHVSVSTPTRCPTWEEMVAIKRHFFRRNEWAFELHPPEAQNINVHDYCLHLWRCQLQDIPTPPTEMI